MLWEFIFTLYKNKEEEDKDKGIRRKIMKKKEIGNTKEIVKNVSLMTFNIYTGVFRDYTECYRNWFSCDIKIKNI